MVNEIDKILKEIENLTHTPGYIYAFAEIIYQDLFLRESEMTTVDWTKRVSLAEASFLLGLCIKQNKVLNAVIPESAQIKDLVDRSRSLLQSLQSAYIKQAGRERAESFSALKEKSLAGVEGGSRGIVSGSIAATDSFMIEAIFYGAPGVFGFQYLEMAPRLYQFDKDWLESKGLNLEHAGIICEAIKFMQEHLHQYILDTEPSLDKKASYRLDKLVLSKGVILNIVKGIDKDAEITEDDVVKFLEFFVAKPGEQNPALRAPGDRNIIQFKPIIKLPDGKYFFPLYFNLTESVYKNPGYLMMADETYRSVAAKNRGEVNEEITYQYFKKIFGASAYKAVKIKSSKKVITDIDVMGVVGDTAIITQNKGKRMTIQSKQGDIVYLKEDFTQAIQDAYNQGLKSRDALLRSANYTFIDESGEEIKFSQDISRVYILCITADVYPAVLFQTRQYLIKKEEDPWPIPLSLLDLDILFEFLPNPHDFATYIQQRADTAGYFKANCEMDMLGFHLKEGLYEIPGTRGYFINSCHSRLIDLNYTYRKGRASKPPSEYSLEKTDNKSSYVQCVLPANPEKTSSARAHKDQLIKKRRKKLKQKAQRKNREKSKKRKKRKKGKKK